MKLLILLGSSVHMFWYSSEGALTIIESVIL